MELKMEGTSALNLVGATGRKYSLTFPLHCSPQRGVDPKRRGIQTG